MFASRETIAGDSPKYFHLLKKSNEFIAATLPDVMKVRCLI
jgi:hypothetical protein